MVVPYKTKTTREVPSSVSEGNDGATKTTLPSATSARFVFSSKRRGFFFQPEKKKARASGGGGRGAGTPRGVLQDRDRDARRGWKSSARTKCKGVLPLASPSDLMSLLVSFLNRSAAARTPSALSLVTASMSAVTASAAPMILDSVSLFFASWLDIFVRASKPEDSRARSSVRSRASPSAARVRGGSGEANSRVFRVCPRNMAIFGGIIIRDWRRTWDSRRRIREASRPLSHSNVEVNENLTNADAMT